MAEALMADPAIAAALVGAVSKIAVMARVSHLSQRRTSTAITMLLAPELKHMGGHHVIMYAGMLPM